MCVSLPFLSLLAGMWSLSSDLTYSQNHEATEQSDWPSRASIGESGLCLVNLRSLALFCTLTAEGDPRRRAVFRGSEARHTGECVIAAGLLGPGSLVCNGASFRDVNTHSQVNFTLPIPWQVATEFLKIQ